MCLNYRVLATLAANLPLARHLAGDVVNTRKHYFVSYLAIGVSS